LLRRARGDVAVVLRKLALFPGEQGIWIRANLRGGGGKRGLWPYPWPQRERTRSKPSSKIGEKRESDSKLSVEKMQKLATKDSCRGKGKRAYLRIPLQGKLFAGEERWRRSSHAE